MLIDRTHLVSGAASGVAFGVVTTAYFASVAGAREGSGGSLAGLAFGVLSFVAMTFAGLLAVRKKFPGLHLGSAQFWLRGHIWLGLLSVPLAMYHANFRFGGALEMVFMLVFFAVILSGLFGLALQQVLPRLLKVRVPLETFPQQIPYLCAQMKDEGDRLLKALRGQGEVRAAPATGTPVVAARASHAAAVATAAGVLPPQDVAAAAAVLPTSGAKPAGVVLSVAQKLAAARDAAKSRTAAPVAGSGQASAEATAPAPDAPSAHPPAAALTVAQKLAAARAAAMSTPWPASTAATTPSAGGGAPSDASAAAPTPSLPPEKPPVATLSVAEKLAAARAAAKSAAAAKEAAAGTVASTAAVPAEPGATVENSAPAAMSIAEKLAAARAAAKAGSNSSAGGTPAGVAPVASPSAAVSDRHAAATALAATVASRSKVAAVAAPSVPAAGPMPRIELLERFYKDKIIPFLSSDVREASRQALVSENYARMAFGNLVAELPTQALETIRELEALVAERRQFLVQVRIQSWLRTWLLVHVPLSAALFALAAVHIISALRVVPFF